MKKHQIFMLFMLMFLSIKSFGQTEGLKYLQDMSESRKASKEKQLEGMEGGSVEKVVLSSQDENSIKLDIYLDGYSGKNLKVMALSDSGVPKIEILPAIKKVSDGKSVMNVELKLSATKEVSSDLIELVFTNGVLRFKGISYVYEFKKTWIPDGTTSTGQGETNSSSSTPKKRTPEIVELNMIPEGEARALFIK